LLREVTPVSLGFDVSHDGFRAHARSDDATLLACPFHAPAPGQPPALEDPFSLPPRSEEHTSELQSRENLVCRLLLEKKQSNRIGFRFVVAYYISGAVGKHRTIKCQINIISTSRLVPATSHLRLIGYMHYWTCIHYQIHRR